jgi:hypothetical protein
MTITIDNNLMAFLGIFIIIFFIFSGGFLLFDYIKNKNKDDNK